MAIRNIRELGDEILRKKSKPVKEITPRITELIKDLKESLKQYNGVGLAAVQVGVLKRICDVCIKKEDVIPENAEEGFEPEPTSHTDGRDLIIINPEIEVIGEECQRGYEGCLSVPGKSGIVTRPAHIKLKAFDEGLNAFELEATGLLARAVCHECDHMDGIIYIDKVEGELKDAEEEE